MAEVRSGGRNNSKISDYLIALSQAKVGNEARLVITFLWVIMVGDDGGRDAGCRSSRMMSPVTVFVLLAVAGPGVVGGLIP